MSRPLWAALLLKGTLPMLATRTNNLRAAPTTTVAELQDILADRARGHHDTAPVAEPVQWEVATRKNSTTNARRCS